MKYYLGKLATHLGCFALIGAAYAAFGVGAGLAVGALYLLTIGYAFQSAATEDIQIRFTGRGPDLQFVEVENMDGESIDVGEWVTELCPGDAEYQLLRLKGVRIDD